MGRAMTNRFKIALAAASVLAIASMATPASAVAIISSCSVVGLDDIVPNAQACAGYYDKNVLKTDAGDLAKADEVAALNLLGLTGTIAALEKINNSGDFDTLLNGLTWIGVHYGRGNGPVNTPGGVTAFYRFDAGTNLDSFSFTNGSISGVALYSTGVIPEPATWGLMILGIGGIGIAMRRRQRQSVRFNFA